MSYTEYFTQQLLMTCPVSVIWKRSFSVNNHLVEISWQLWFSVTPCILIYELDQFKLCIALCAYFWLLLLNESPEMWHHTINTSTGCLQTSQFGHHPKSILLRWVPQYCQILMICGRKGDGTLRMSYRMDLPCHNITQ